MSQIKQSCDITYTKHKCKPELKQLSKNCKTRLKQPNANSERKETSEIRIANANAKLPYTDTQQVSFGVLVKMGISSTMSSSIFIEPKAFTNNAQKQHLRTHASYITIYKLSLLASHI